MASEEQKALSNYVKDVHSALRKSTIKFGAEKAWKDHSTNSEVLKRYAHCMQKLATEFWDHNSALESSEVKSRIDWAAKFCYDYFKNESYLQYRERENIIAEKIQLKLNSFESFSEKLKLIDVGSCYNPFKFYNYFDVLAIDLCPANESVLNCDFLNTQLGDQTIVQDNKVKQIGKQNYEIATFCFLLEYIPTSQLRLTACEKAYDILKPGGLLIITTPDSKHVGANSKIMKCWRYTLANIGFSRIHYEKFRHIHCMAFRKSLIKNVAVRWAEIHKEPYMEYAIYIPQDFNLKENEDTVQDKIAFESVIEDFQELPHFS